MRLIRNTEVELGIKKILLPTLVSSPLEGRERLLQHLLNSWIQEILIQWHDRETEHVISLSVYPSPADGSWFDPSYPPVPAAWWVLYPKGVCWRVSFEGQMFLKPDSAGEFVIRAQYA